MHSNLSESVIRDIQQREPHEVVALTLCTNTVFESTEIELLDEWGGRLLFDSGIVAFVHLSVGRIYEIAAWDCVTEVHRLSSLMPTEPELKNSNLENIPPAPDSEEIFDQVWRFDFDAPGNWSAL